MTDDAPPSTVSVTVGTEALRDPAMCLRAVKVSGYDIRHVPDALKTVELCAIACVQSGLAWDFVPAELRVPEVRFCRAMHGFGEESAERVFQKMFEAGQWHALETVEKYEALFEAMHYGVPGMELNPIARPRG